MKKKTNRRLSTPPPPPTETDGPGEKAFHCMMDIEKFLNDDLQNKYEPADALRAMCWAVGAWISQSEGDSAFAMMGACLQDICYGIERNRFMKAVHTLGQA